ncbi:Mucolipin-3 [Hypsibius exemplaris]|uniref:Mucolipin-3 n=1 Tax=Hypsibius exemplaris TaxID=2072580 RepID=A0A1W0WDM9_HYPEX|nr:Mucolipin-3 [Hypsibius exemplaris]
MGSDDEFLAADIPLIDLQFDWTTNPALLTDPFSDIPLFPIIIMASPEEDHHLPVMVPRPVSPETVNDIFDIDTATTLPEPLSNSSSNQQQHTPSQRDGKSRRVSATLQHLHLASRHRSPSPGRTNSTRLSTSVDPAVVAHQPNEDENSVYFSPMQTNGAVISTNGDEDGYQSPRVQQPCCSAEVNRMKWRIKFFFMDPIQKWKTRHQFPWKLFLQVIKIVFVTIQLVMFGNERYAFARFLAQNTVSFRHLMLQDWNDPDIPVQVYPNSGLYACYLKTEVFQKMDFAANQFLNLREIAIGTYHHATSKNDTPHFQICKREFIQAHIFPQNHSYVYDSNIQEICLSVDPTGTGKGYKFDTADFLRENNASINFDQLVDAKLVFGVKSVSLDPSDPDDTPDCYVFDITLRFDNTGHNGQIQVTLDLDPHVVPCNGRMLFDDGQSVWDILVDVLDSAVLIICIMSLLLCLRALYNAQMLKNAVVEFFDQQYGAQLSKDERLEFLNLWYAMIVVNDIFIICGTVIKLRISSATITEMPLYNACGMLLGVGNLLVWIGILRYLGFFRTYNILILTFKRAIPNVLRYMACIVLIFCGFAFCGWIVLGPYHVKFQTFHSTTETIFSLINGDDMFATFAILPWENSMIWYFSRVYLYTFICMFTYVVLSLMISLIMDAYGTVKDFYEQGGPSSRLTDFINEVSSSSLSAECAKHRVQGSFGSFDASLYGCRRTWCSCFDWLKKKTQRRSSDMFDSADSRSSWVPHQRLSD